MYSLFLLRHVFISRNPNKPRWEISIDSKGCPGQTPIQLFPFGRSFRRNVIQLASFPGSGNTWMRHLLEKGSGIVTGNIYSPDPAYLNIFPGESIRDGRRVIAIKTHYPCLNCFSLNHTYGTFRDIRLTGMIFQYSATIQIIRNPFESIISFFNYVFTDGNHTGIASQEQFFSKDFQVFAQKKALGWVYHTNYYLHYKINDF